MNLLEQKQLEIEALKSKLKAQEEKLASLEKLNQWYIEQLKLRQQKKFGASSEKADQDQIAIADVFSDLFNELEVLREAIAAEPDAIANELKPMRYLQYVFEQIQSKKDSQISEILPWSENIPETCKNINTPKS